MQNWSQKHKHTAFARVGQWSLDATSAARDGWSKKKTDACNVLKEELKITDFLIVKRTWRCAACQHAVWLSKFIGPKFQRQSIASFGSSFHGTQVRDMGLMEFGRKERARSTECQDHRCVVRSVCLSSHSGVCTSTCLCTGPSRRTCPVETRCGGRRILSPARRTTLRLASKMAVTVKVFDSPRTLVVH